MVLFSRMLVFQRDPGTKRALSAAWEASDPIESPRLRARGLKSGGSTVLVFRPRLADKVLSRALCFGVVGLAEADSGVKVDSDDSSLMEFFRWSDEADLLSSLWV